MVALGEKGRFLMSEVALQRWISPKSEILHPTLCTLHPAPDTLHLDFKRGRRGGGAGGCLGTYGGPMEEGLFLMSEVAL